MLRLGAGVYAERELNGSIQVLNKRGDTGGMGTKGGSINKLVVVYRELVTNHYNRLLLRRNEEARVSSR